ncbi:MAG: dihydrofolate reductase [Eubacteriales bacterium]|nr:dihydrofolate reductase [Eubacteriales bacterium]
MKIIAAADRNWGIGKDGRRLVSIPADLKAFRKEVEGKTVVMGRKTLEDLPGGLPVQGAENIIISRNPNLKVRGAAVVHSLEEMERLISDLDSDEVYVIGGGEIYEALLPKCDTAYITRIDFGYEADRHFPNLDEMEDWMIVSESDEQTYFDLEYTFTTYERKNRD